MNASSATSVCEPDANKLSKRHTVKYLSVWVFGWQSLGTSVQCDRPSSLSCTACVPCPAELTCACFYDEVESHAGHQRAQISVCAMQVQVAGFETHIHSSMFLPTQAHLDTARSMQGCPHCSMSQAQLAGEACEHIFVNNHKLVDLRTDQCKLLYDTKFPNELVATA